MDSIIRANLSNGKSQSVRVSRPKSNRQSSLEIKCELAIQGLYILNSISWHYVANSNNVSVHTRNSAILQLRAVIAPDFSV